MDFAATLFSTGWASGVNAYGTVALLGILGRLNVGDVPADLERTPVIAIALGLFLVEFVVDKVPWLDSLWDTVHTVIRPLIGAALGFQFGGEQGIGGLEEAFGAGATGMVALASHGVKAGMRLAINTSPEPATNITASLAEDGLVAIVVLFSLNHPVLAATIAGVLLVVGMALVALLWSRVRAALRRRRARRSGAPPQEPAEPRAGPSRRTGFLGLMALLLILGGITLGVRTVIDDGDFSGDPRGAAVVKFEIDSGAVGRSEPVSLVIPPGAKDEGRPLLVFLHGRSGDENSTLVDAMFAELDALGDRAPVVVAPDGGGSSYWHDRDSGEWGDYVFDEVIPQALERSGANPERIAIGGISMGGFGALDIARLHPGAFCAVGGHSPAIWASAGETAPGAFDDAADFADHDLVLAAGTDPAGLAGPRLWLDAGDQDPFLAGDDALEAALAASGVDFTEHRWPGAHDGDYWNSHWASYLDFYAGALERC